MVAARPPKKLATLHCNVVVASKMDPCCSAKGWRKAYLQIYGSLLLADLEL
jgi:hypothetical protein